MEEPRGTRKKKVFELFHYDNAEGNELEESKRKVFATSIIKDTKKLPKRPHSRIPAHALFQSILS